MTTHLSADGLALIEAFEGCLAPVPGRPGQFTTYRCPAGVLTIGFGHTNHHPPRFAEGEVWSRAKCRAVLAADLRLFEARVRTILAGVQLAQHEFDALVSFDFNTGGLDRSSIPAKIRAGRRGDVRATLARWNKARGRVLRGLVRRRAAEADLFDGRVEEALRKAGALRRSAGPMPQKAERPRPPASELARRTRAETGAIVAGGTAAGTATQAPDEGAALLPPLGIAFGLIVIAVAALLIWRKRRLLAAEWA